jgi:hypothetical protein
MILVSEITSPSTRSKCTRISRQAAIGNVTVTGGGQCSGQDGSKPPKSGRISDHGHPASPQEKKLTRKRDLLVGNSPAQQKYNAGAVDGTARGGTELKWCTRKATGEKRRGRFLSSRSPRRRRFALGGRRWTGTEMGEQKAPAFVSTTATATRSSSTCIDFLPLPVACWRQLCSAFLAAAKVRNQTCLLGRPFCHSP